MSIILKEHVSLKEYSALAIGGRARYFATIQEVEDLELFSKQVTEKNISSYILGKGSNTIFADGKLNIIVGLMLIRGIQITKEDADFVCVQIGAGEIWDDVVEWTCERSYSGIEALAAIPGTAGATPVQNVGAYGQEIKDTFVELYAYDQKEERYVTLTNEQCHFGYRTSIFNTTEKGRYLIGHITLKFSKSGPQIPAYPGVKEKLLERGVSTPTPKDISDTITSIRWAKLPKPHEIPNVGSFFKNAFVDHKKAAELKQAYTDIKLFEEEDGKIKVPSGWLIEQCGLKGQSFGPIKVYEKNALVLVNTGDASFNELLFAKEQIVDAVREKFGITLVQEPNMVV